MDHIQTQLDRIDELDDAALSELQSSVISEFETVEAQDLSPETVDAMSSLADMLDTVRGEMSNRVARAEELAARASEASSRVKGEVAPEDGEVEPAPEDSEEPEEAPVEEEVPALSASIVVEEESEASTEEITETLETSETIEELSADAEVVEEVIEEESGAEASTEEEAPADSVETPETELAVEAEAEAVSDVELEAEASTLEESETIAPEAQEEAPVTAAADEAFDAPADRRPVAKAISAPVAITAGADIPNLTAGSTISDMSGVAKAMTDRLGTLRHVRGGDGEQHTVASVTTMYPEERTLTSDQASNREKILNVVGPAALTASGGFAAPLSPEYDIFGFGTDARPVRDSLPRFQADRGGIRFITPPVLSSYTGAVGIWTNAMDIDAAPDGDPVKNSWTATSAATVDVLTHAVTLQIKFGNLLTRAFPELIARHNELALIAHARLAEQTLLTNIGTASTAVTTTTLIGFARDFLVQVKRAAAAYRSRHRIDPSTQLRAIIPSWVIDAMAADLTLNMPGDDNLGVTRAEINSYLALSNVTLTETLDQNVFAAQTAAALLEFPDSFVWYLFSEGSFVFLDGGTLDIGLVRDSGLVATNDYRMFTETFENVAFVGIESLKITSTINVNGSAAALRDTTGGATAAAEEF